MRVYPLALAAFVATISAPALAATVEVEVSNVTLARGNVFVALCTSALEPERCQKTLSATATGPTVRVVFSEVPAGRYAIAAFQDFDGTGVLRRGKLGIPLEPYGFSNNAGLSRRPKFDAAAFSVGEGVRTVSVALRRTGHRSDPEE